MQGESMSVLRKLSHCLPDELYIQLQYFHHFHKFANLKHPQTFNEKLNWLKLHDRNPLYTTLVDKYAVKQWVADKIGAQYIIPTLGVWNKAEDIDFDKLPHQFVLKCTHDSHSIVICRDKSKLDKPQTIKKLSARLKSNGYWYGREWPYKNVPPRIIAEKYMEDCATHELHDYKFFCFNGNAKLMYISKDIASDPRTDFFNMAGEHISLRMLDRNSDTVPHLPAQFPAMRKLAEKLSKEIPFVRVDFYIIEGKIYFGELTFYHASGYAPLRPASWNNTLGSYICLPSK